MPLLHAIDRVTRQQVPPTLVHASADDSVKGAPHLGHGYRPGGWLPAALTTRSKAASVTLSLVAEHARHDEC